MSEDANNLLHDALVAEQIALVTTLVESFPEDDRGWIIDSIDVPSLHVTERNRRGLGSGLPEGTRAHNFEHLLSAILDRPIVKSIGLGFSPKGETSGLKKIWKLDSDHAEIPRDDLSHVPQRALKDIVSNGTIEAEIMLHNGSWLLFDTPVLSVNPFSTWRFGASLLVGLLVTIFVATWVLTRWSEPLTVLAHAAERFAGDVKAPPLLERGPSEVRVAVQAFNRMQEQLRCLIEDRIQLAAAIAHDLGTPITRLRLRAEAIESDEQRGKFLDDLTQMQRMIGAALDFARQDMAFEPFEALDLSSLLQ
ncbi:MAG: HAMP domain-containing protein, partial [Burkholderiales bacterium]|nr:HAMP domain-containing protein [Burkholderiales bacterium]